MRFPLFILLLGLAACVFAAEKPAQLDPAPKMTPAKCAEVGQYLFWVADYRDVKADKALVKGRLKTDHSMSEYLKTQIDVVYESTDEGKVIADRFYSMCTAPRSGT